MCERVLSEHPGSIMLFTDTKWEDCDNYRFLHAVVARMSRLYQATFVHLAEGRDPEQVFLDSRYLGNDRAPLCSRILKGEMTAKWLQDVEGPVTLYFGITWMEAHRGERIQKRYNEQFKGRVSCSFPMCSPPYLNDAAMRRMVEKDWDIPVPRMYRLAEYTRSQKAPVHGVYRFPGCNSSQKVQVRRL